MTDIVVSASSKKDFDPIPAGVHIAVCYAIYDIGTHKKTWEGVTKLVQRIYVSWELPDERDDFEVNGKLVNLPRAISNRYTKSLDERAELRKHLIAWRGRDFTKPELDGFSLKNILGKACQLQVVHKPKRDGGVWANIGAVMALPKGAVAPPPENPLRMWAPGDDETGVPKWIIKAAAESEEAKHGQITTAPAEQEPEDQVPF